ncbi:sulfate permease [Venturia nashicola]|nr:sulfate permease [Venturia nashicola]
MAIQKKRSWRSVFFSGYGTLSELILSGVVREVHAQHIPPLKWLDRASSRRVNYNNSIIVITLGQRPSIFGLANVRSGTANILHELLTTLEENEWRIVSIDFSGISILQSLQWAGKRTRVENPLFEISKIQSAGISAPSLPPSELIGKVAVKAVAPFLAATLENTDIMKAFALKNGYRVDAPTPHPSSVLLSSISQNYLISILQLWML